MDIQEKLLLRDIRRILHVLPSQLRWRVYGLLFLMFVLAFFEVISIFSMSLMAMSIAAPQAILSHRIVQELLQAIPALGQLCNDLRYFTLLTACIVVAFAAIKNGLSALVGWKAPYWVKISPSVPAAPSCGTSCTVTTWSIWPVTVQPCSRP